MHFTTHAYDRAYQRFHVKLSRKAREELSTSIEKGMFPLHTENNRVKAWRITFPETDIQALALVTKTDNTVLSFFELDYLI